MRALFPLPLLLAACGSPGDPAWGVDTFTVEPTADGAFALQRWDVFDADWEASGAPRDHVCGAVVVVNPVPRTADCPECVIAWDAAPTLRETDCAGVDEQALLRVSALGIGAVPEDLLGEDPHPGESVGAWVQIDGGAWLPHGWAYPESLDHGGAGGEWDGETIFTLWPDAAWPL